MQENFGAKLATENSKFPPGLSPLVNFMIMLMIVTSQPIDTAVIDGKAIKLGPVWSHF